VLSLRGDSIAPGVSTGLFASALSARECWAERAPRRGRSARPRRGPAQDSECCPQQNRERR